MLKRKVMLNWLFSAANGWVALVALAVLLGSTWVLGRNNPKEEIIQKLGDAYVSTDSDFLYDPAKAEKMFLLYKARPDEEQRELFAAHRRFLTFHDRIYPLCYAVPLVLLLAYFYPPLPPGEGRRFGLLVLLPLLAMIFDYAENQTILSVLGSVEATGQVPLQALGRARIFTAVKIGLLGASLLLLLGFAACAQGRRLRELVGRS